MKKPTYLALLSLMGLSFFGCTETEDIISVCLSGKVIDYNCGRKPVVQILTPDTRIGVKVPVGDGTKEVENVVQVNNLPPEFNKPGVTFYFSFRLAKEAEKDYGPCPAIYVPYDVPQLLVNGIWELPCPDGDEDWDDWD